MGNVHDFQCTLVGAYLGEQRIVPGHHGDDHENRQQVEHADAPNHRTRGLGNVLRGIVGFGGGDGDRFSTNEAEHDGDESADYRRQAVGGKSAMLGHQAAQSADLPFGHPAHQHGKTHADETDDRHDLGHGEPELEFAVLGHAEQVGHHQCNDRHQGEQPGIDLGKPLVQHMAGGQCFDRDHQYPEPPVQPTDGEACPTTYCLVGIGGERACVRVGHRHFTEHTHDQNDKQA
ncbi:hypothetical protein D3C72_1555330 [compost metagenome]